MANKTIEEFVMKKMEEKLIELMGQEDYSRFAAEVAKEGFRKEIEDMPDREFREFCMEHFDTITGGSGIC